MLLAEFAFPLGKETFQSSILYFLLIYDWRRIKRALMTLIDEKMLPFNLLGNGQI